MSSVFTLPRPQREATPVSSNLPCVFHTQIENKVCGLEKDTETLKITLVSLTGLVAKNSERGDALTEILRVNSARTFKTWKTGIALLITLVFAIVGAAWHLGNSIGTLTAQYEITETVNQEVIRGLEDRVVRIEGRVINQPTKEFIESPDNDFPSALFEMETQGR